MTVAFYMDRQKEEREKKVPPLCATEMFFTDTWPNLRHRRRTVLHGPSTPIHYRCTILHWRVTLHHHRRTCARGSHHQHDHGCDHTHVPAYGYFTTATATKHAESKDRHAASCETKSTSSGFVQDGLRHCWLPAKTTLTNNSSSALPTSTFHRISQ